MPATRLDHYTIRCTDMEQTREFYQQVVGLQIGERPDLGVKGYWLYAGDTPVVHLLDKAEMEEISGDVRANSDTAALDHVAFLCQGLEETRTLLTQNGIAYQETHFPGLMYQIFVTDPDNVLVEMNFRETQG
ncbi:MAG: glyoxalase [Alphaproteobacteria bacterium]|nr:MAG: glyoxalase [Alphaproteobacteria bacterium]